MKYIKLFKTKAQYEAFKASAEYLKPNLSFCTDDNKAFMEKFVDNRLVITYNINTPNEPTRFFFDVTSYPVIDFDFNECFTKMEIDGTELETPVASYTFTTTGEHVVKLTPDYDCEFVVGEGAEEQTFTWVMVAYLMFWGVNNITSVIFPKGMTDICSFQNCTALETVVFPEDLTAIKDETFRDCTGLTELNLPKNLKKIQGFMGCTGLTSIHLPPKLTEIGDNAFDGCTGLTAITIPQKVRSIGQKAFSQCSNIETLTIENGVQEIGDYAFEFCVGLTSIEIPESIIRLGFSAFGYCDNLEEVTFNASNCSGPNVTTNGAYVFKDSPVTTVTIGPNVRVIPSYVFSYNTNIESIEFNSGNGSLAIEDDAFCGCTSLQNFDFSNVSSIGKSAFNGCSSLESFEWGDNYEPGDGVLRIPAWVTGIGLQAFLNCTSLVRIEIEDDFHGEIGDSAFAGCSNVQAIYSYPSTPPTIGFGAFNNTGNCPIYVNDVQAYQAASGWSTYASRIVAIDNGTDPGR